MRRVSSAVLGGLRMPSVAARSYASLAVGMDIVSAAPDVSLQKARSWDEGVSSKFSTTPLKDIFEVRVPPDLSVAVPLTELRWMLVTGCHLGLG